MIKKALDVKEDEELLILEKNMKRLNKENDEHIKKIESAQLTCNPKLTTLMDNDTITEYENMTAQPGTNKESLFEDPIEESRYFKKYMDCKFDQTRSQFRKVVNKIRFEQRDTMKKMHQEEAKLR